MNKLKLIVAVLLGLLVLPRGSAHAEEFDTSQMSIAEEGEVGAGRAPRITTSVGLRLGGYGFSHVDEGDDDLSWDGCRMDGIGVFANFDSRGPWYGEVSLDFYHSTGQAMVEDEIERQSGLMLVGVGVRPRLRIPIAPHLIVGTGGEFTHVEYEDRAVYRALPTVFLGFGAEWLVGDFALGMAVRSYAMGAPVSQYDNRDDIYNEPVWDDDEPEDIEFEVQTAGQVLFTARYIF